MDYSEQREQHEENIRYTQWQDRMYVMIEDLECDYELAVVENSLRDSVYFADACFFGVTRFDNCLGVFDSKAGLWATCKTKLTRAQALYIATGDTNI
tara:strand:- start:28 stop:318 length:291 start_codon:yes stop_codon:yes gene_type:complete